ncbi:MAG: S23-interacting protein [Peltula sp. TS41687]|nr:MAG: S23-interacting protein [Peltula sp. TS41687]
MAPPQHTYGPNCLLAWDAKLPAHATGDSPPAVNAQFFYQSAFPIDDPLSPVPPPSSNTASAAIKHPIRPFTPHDNAALEEAWQQLGTKICGEKGWEGLEASVAEGNSSRRGIESDSALEKRGRDRVDPQGHHGREVVPEISRVATLRRDDGHAKKHKKRPIDSRAIKHESITAARAGCARREYVEEGEMEENNDEVNRPVSAMAFDVHNASKMSPSRESHTSSMVSAMSYPPSRVGLSNKTTTGTPFLRAPPRRRRSISPGPEVDGNVETPASESYGRQSPSGATPAREDFVSDDYEPFDINEVTDPMASSLGNPTDQRDNQSIEVPVGISSLHVVELPDLEMKPIYWSAVNDISSVTRGTWFYRDTMYPVEAEVSNQLEIGYLDLKVWTETWNDELNSALAVGAEGEAKVVHRIWPTEEPKKANDADTQETTQDKTRTARGSVVLTRTEDLLVRSTGAHQASDGLRHVAAEGHHDSVKGKGRSYANSSVVYKNEREAFILRPNLLPSAYYGRRPLAKIRRGFVVGIPVVRGFSWKTWDRIHPTKKTLLSVRAEEGAEASQSGAANAYRGSRGCPACLVVERPQNVTDLVLVIHGIGQKLSQRIESFSFTHLVNSLRRQVHVELGNPVVKSLLRPGHGGIMTLPINWRALLTFDDTDMSDPNQAGKKHTWTNEFGLKEITPETIPSVRNLISDVMLDIPYYLSHHKSEMVEAVTREANRVYRLWCKNNPGFEKTGRVHLIAHSLGSVMALDILSKQPTRLPESIDLTSSTINTHRFDFDTKSLFFCGSPAGFFLLLNKASLLPRKGRNKPGADGEDAGRRVAGEANTYGCLAIDNIYNVLNHYDPIAYRLNATVDTSYAASLKPALLPSTTTSFLSSLTSLISSSSSDPAAQNRPAINRLQSTIELETHNFTREEIAERRMYLLNDNGQIDYFLPTGGGPLDIQYLNILSAHSSYWTSREFVRFLVVEIGRSQGRQHTLGNMRAVKVARKS